MRLAAIVIEEHAGAAVQLRNDDPFRPVDDEGAVISHKRQFAEIDFLLAHILDRLLRPARLFV